MSNVSDFYLQGSFKGVPFLFRETRKRIGRQRITYQYPQKSINSRSVIDNGLYEPDYSLTVYLTGSGIDYYDNKRRFENILNSYGSGILIHPTDGEVRCQVGINSVIESTEEVGRVTYQVEFSATSEPQFPTITDNATSNIENRFNSTLNELLNAFNNAWAATLSFQNAITKYRDYLQQVLNRFRSSLQLVSIDKDRLSVFINNLNTVESNKNEIVTQGSQTSQAIANLYKDMSNLTDDVNDKSTLNQHFFNFTVDGETNNNTLARVEAQRNAKLMALYVNSYALTYDFQNTSQNIYLTEDDIKIQSENLNTQYDLTSNINFYLDEFGSRQSLISQDTIDNVTFLRDKTTQYLTNQLANARQIETIYVSNRSLVDLVYDLYGNLDLYDAIAQLNQFANQSVITGTIKVLSQ